MAASVEEEEEDGPRTDADGRGRAGARAASSGMWMMRRRRRHLRQEMKIDFGGEAHAVVRIEGRTDRLEAGLWISCNF